MFKKGDPMAIKLGAKGGKAKVPKGFASATHAQRMTWVKKSNATKRKKHGSRKSV